MQSVYAQKRQRRGRINKTDSSKQLTRLHGAHITTAIRRLQRNRNDAGLENEDRIRNYPFGEHDIFRRISAQAHVLFQLCAVGIAEHAQCIHGIEHRRMASLGALLGWRVSV